MADPCRSDRCHVWRQTPLDTTGHGRFSAPRGLSALEGKATSVDMEADEKDTLMSSLSNILMLPGTAIFADQLVWGVNVGTYSLHGVFDGTWEVDGMVPWKTTFLYETFSFSQCSCL